MIWKILSNIWNFFENRFKFLRDYFNDCNIREIFERSEEFAKNKLVLIYDIDEYVLGTKNCIREFRVIMTKLLVYIHLYKVFIIGFIDDIRIRYLFMDYTLNSNGNRLLYSFAFSSLGLIIFIASFLLQYLEMSRQMTITKICHLIKYRIIKYPLNSNNFRKYCFYLKIVSLIFFNSIFNTLAIIFTICHIFAFGSYPRIGSEYYSIFGQILGNITFFFTFYCASAYLFILIFIWVSFFLYLKYKFEEINTKIELSLKQMNIRLLMNAIHEHNYVERLTRDINFLLSRGIFFMYYFFTFTSQLFLFISQREDTFLSQRIAFLICGIWYIFLILVMNLICNQISARAHKSYPSIFSIFKEDFRMSLKQRLKLWSFMEKLSGPQIGFYCYDLFAMNSKQFYEYITIYVSNYLLIISLFP